MNTDTENQTKARPVLMCGEMVRAWLAGRKAQTRREVKVRQKGVVYDLDKAVKDGPNVLCAGEYLRVPFRLEADAGWEAETMERIYCPYGEPGDRLWVKETFRCHLCLTGIEFVMYRANCLGNSCRTCGETYGKWKPSIFMPRGVSRITLEVAAVRVERLQQISEADAMAEGIMSFTKDKILKKYWPCDPTDGDLKCAWVDMPRTAKEAYRVLWNSLNLKPQAVYGRDSAGKKVIVSYVSTPWSVEDFDNAQYAAARRDGIFRGKPLAVNANCWVWVVEFLPASV